MGEPHEPGLYRRRSSRSSRSRSRDRDRRRSRSRSRGRRSRDKDRDKDRRRRTSSRERTRRSRSSRSRSRNKSRNRSRTRSRSRSRSMSEDGVGGYRPRRRQEPAKPTAASMFATNDPFAHLRSKAPLDPAEAMRVWQEQMLKSRQLVLAQQAKSAVQQANKAQRELYIGNLTSGTVTDVMLRQVFDSALIAAFPQAAMAGQEPVIKVSLHSDGRYGFVEFRSPEYATAALELNGQINLMGQALSIGRPASYVDPGKVNQAAQQAEAALAAFKQGVPIASLVGPGGADIAAPTPLVPGSQAAFMSAAGNLAAAGHNGGVPGDDAAGAAATPYLCVTGMVTSAVLADEEEYREVMLDLQEECEKFGQVVDVKIPRPADAATVSAVFGTQNYGKAFVQFSEAPAALAAQQSIHGRMFAGCPVQAVFVTAEAYAAATEDASRE